MAEWYLWTSGFVWGAAVSLLYFGGLWFTVRQLQGCEHPGRLYVMSLATRLCVLAMVLFLLLHRDRRQAVAAGVGFLIVRIVLVYRLGRSRAEDDTGPTERSMVDSAGRGSTDEHDAGDDAQDRRKNNFGIFSSHPAFSPEGRREHEEGCFSRDPKVDVPSAARPRPS